MFSKRHYEFIAQTIRTSSVCDEELNQIANEFADRLAKDNPRFDRERFVDACVPRN